MKEHWQKAREWWIALSQREKQALTWGGVVLGVFILYQGIWAPLIDGAQAMRKRIVSQQKTLAWMRVADKALQKTEGQSKERNKSASPVVLLSFMQKQITEARLDSALTQLKQGSNETIEMHFQKVEFDRLVAMLAQAIKIQSVSIAQMTVMAEGTSGIVNADVILKLE